MATLSTQNRPLASSSNFPPKFSPLPNIGALTARGEEETALVPANHFKNEDSDMSDRFRQVEIRLNVTEKSNRALLEEVVRLQSELKGSTHRNEQIAREERQARAQLESALRGANELVSQLSMRLQRAEEKVQEERSTLSGLMNHSKSVEQTIITGQQELMSRRDLQNTKIQEVRSDLDELTRSKETLEKVTYQLLDDVRTIKSRLDTQTSDFTAIALDLRNKTKKIEEEGRHTRLESMRLNSETQNQAESSTQQLRQQIESRLSELRDVIIELRNQQEREANLRRSLEQQSQLKFSDLQAAITEQNRKREEALHAIQLAQKERDHHAEHERLRLENKMGEITEEVNKRILQKEIALRQESQDKFGTLESMLLNEQVQRQKYEQSHRQDLEQRWTALKQINSDEMLGLRDVLKTEKQKNQEIFRQFNDWISLVEKKLEIIKKDHEKVLAAEIKSRKSQQHEMDAQFSALNEKLQAAISALQQAIGGVQGRIEEEAKKSRRELMAKADDRREADLRAMADMDARINGLTRRVAKAEDDLNVRVTEVQQATAATVREKVEAITMWQDITQQSMRELQGQMRDVPREIRNLEDRIRSLQTETDSRIRQEAESRLREIEDLKRDIEAMRDLSKNSQFANKGELETCQQSIRKLAEAVQTVKTVLGIKMQSEQQLRETTTENLQQQIDDIRRHLDHAPPQHKERPPTPPSPPHPHDPNEDHPRRSPESPKY